MRPSIVVRLGLVASLLVAGTSIPAGAISVNFNFGVGSNVSFGNRISCARGEQLLRDRGFLEIRRVDCRGRFFVYRGWRGGKRYEISIRASDGHVVDYRRVGR